MRHCHPRKQIFSHNKHLLIALSLVPPDIHSSTAFVDLSYSKIKSLTKHSFCRHTSLLYLNLSNNAIAEIDNIAFYKLKKLQILDLSNNNLKEFPRDPFMYARSIKYISVRNNNIQVLPEKFSLYGTITLEVLDLGQLTNLSQISKNAFINLKNLKYLYLDNCKMSDIPYLNRLQSIRRINLSNNRIQIITSDNFQELYLLETIDLSNNNIIQIQEGAFVGLEALKFLNLASTSLRTIENVIFGRNRKDMIVNFENNNWECTCKNKWLVKWIQNNLQECTMDKYRGSPQQKGDPYYCAICDLPSKWTGYTIDILITAEDSCKQIYSSNSLINKDTSTLKPMTRDTKIINTQLGKKITLNCNDQMVNQQSNSKTNNYEYTWTRNNQEIQTTGNNMKMKISVNGNLEINTVEVGHMGQYTCIKKNKKLGYQPTQFFINVTDAPRTQSFTVTETVTSKKVLVQGLGNKPGSKQIKVSKVT